MTIQDYLKTLAPNWEEELERRMLYNHLTSREHSAYIASPCRADTPDEVLQNMKAARFYLHYAMSQDWFNAYAPQAFLPPLLSDARCLDRETAMKLGMYLLIRCRKLYLCGKYISEGMRTEMLYTAEKNRPIYVFDYQLSLEATQIVKQAGLNEKLIVHDTFHPTLSLSAKELLDLGVLHA